MATLEKIRSKSVLLMVIIGVALLAFIIGDGLTSGRTLFSNPTMIAKVGDHKIDITDFQRRYEQANQRLQQQGSKEDPAVVQQQILNGMVQEALLDDEIEALGIKVTDKELSRAMVGPEAFPMMVQFARQYGFESPDQMLDVVKNPSKYQVPAEQATQLLAVWNEQESNMERGLKQMKFANIMSGVIAANELDAKALYDSNASTSHISYVKKDYSSLPDDKYPVSDDEIKAQYNKEKNIFKTDQESRTVNYIAVPVVPSQIDIVAGQQVVETAIAELTAKPDLEGVAGNVDFGVDRQSQTAARITNPALKQFVTAAAPGDVKLTSQINNEYSIAKFFGSKSQVDSINIDMVAFAGPAAARDSLLAALNSGKPFDDALKMSGVQGGQADLWTSMLQVNNDSIKSRLLNAPAGYFIGDSVGEQAMIYRVNEKKAPVTVYDFATVSYKIEPSDETITNLNNNLDKFIVENNNAPAMTAEKAAAAGYTLLPSSVTATSAQLANIPSSRAAVKWAMEADKGQVSPVFEVGNSGNQRLLVVALTDINEPGFVPVSDPQVKMYLTNKVRNDKKAADLIAQYKGKAKDLNGYAQLIAPGDTAAIATANVTFGQPFITGIGFGESALLGRVPATKVNTLAGPVKTNNAIIVYQVTSVDNEGRPYNYDESAARYAGQLGSQSVMNKVVDILRNGTEVETDLLKFYSE